jgi:hypothetical protein
VRLAEQLRGRRPVQQCLGDQAFVISEVNGTWAAAQAVVGTLSSSGGAQVTSVSCASAGSCEAGGSYLGTGRGYVLQGFAT